MNLNNLTESEKKLSNSIHNFLFKSNKIQAQEIINSKTQKNFKQEQKPISKSPSPNNYTNGNRSSNKTLPRNFQNHNTPSLSPNNREISKKDSKVLTIEKIEEAVTDRNVKLEKFPTFDSTGTQAMDEEILELKQKIGQYELEKLTTIKTLELDKERLSTENFKFKNQNKRLTNEGL